jgi:hypothetical protein
MDRALRDKVRQEALQETQQALHEEVRKHKLEFAELSIMMRELLTAVYLRGELDAVDRIRRAIKKPDGTNEEKQSG